MINKVLFVFILIMVMIITIITYRILYISPSLPTIMNYSIESIYDPINLKHIKNFLSNTECDYIVNAFENKTTRSLVTIGTKDSQIDDIRTSSSYYIPRNDDLVMQSIDAKIIEYMNRHVGTKNWLPTLELLQIVKYQEGQEFKEHHDWFDSEFVKKNNNNQRQYTFFIYLNDVESGGETIFPIINKTFVPKKGDALFWENCKTPEICHNDSLHKGSPPLKGIKYGLNVWIRFHPLT